MTYATPTNITSLVGLFQYANETTNNLYVILLLSSMYLVGVIYMTHRGTDWLDASMASGFVVSISAILLRTAEIIPEGKGHYVFIAISTLVLPLTVKLFQDKTP